MGLLSSRTSGILLVVALTLAGCLSAPASSPNESRGTPLPGEGNATEDQEQVPFTTVDVGTQSGVGDARRDVISDNATWAAFWKQHKSNEGSPPEAPSVDFSREVVVAVFAGTKPDACWAIRVTNATQSSANLTVDVTTFSPEPGTGCATVVSQPFHVVRLSRTSAPVVFRESVAAGEPPAS